MKELTFGSAFERSFLKIDGFSRLTALFVMKELTFGSALERSFFINRWI
jgi:hypothetical protein